MKHKASRLRSAGSALMLASSVGAAHAIEIDTGNADLAIRWDNTLRYNMMVRVEKQNQAILKSPNSDDGDRNFDRGIVGNRVDLLSEFDLTYRQNAGLRVSAAAWYDAAYRHLDNKNVSTSNHLVNGAAALGLSDATKRFHQGPSGEFLDAFVFGKFDLGSMPVNVKAGRHTLFWGEALLSPIHSLSFGQAPLDLRKAASVPGTEAKELFFPRNALSAQMQVNPEVSLAAQYFLEWKPFRMPEAGSFQGAADMLQQGGEALLIAPGVYWLHGSDVKPKKQGDWGVSARWRPQFLDGTAGAYLRRTADIQPQMHVDPIAGRYHLVYPGNIDILGLSLAKNVAGTSLGAEVNYRRNMPLSSGAVVILPAPAAAVTPGAIAALPTQGETGGARGNTWHAVVNVLGSLGKTPLFDAASWIAEVQFNHLVKVTQGQAVFNGNAAYVGLDKVTRNYLGAGVTFTPTWFQVFPGVDLSAPLVYMAGLSGTSAVAGGGNKKAGSYSIGLTADAYQKYRFDLSYVDTFGLFSTDASGGIASSAGPFPLTKDRGFVSLTFKTTF